MTKREINAVYGVITEPFSDKVDLELDRTLGEIEILEYEMYIISLLNYLQSDLKYDS